MSRTQTSVYLGEAMIDAIDQLADASKTTENVPEMSKSEVMRQLIQDGLEENPELFDLLDEDTRILLEREKFMGKEGKVSNLRTGFRSKVMKTVNARFKNGFNPDELRGFAENMHRDVEILWPEYGDEDYSDKRAEMHEYVDRTIEEAIGAQQTSAYDPLNPAERFSEYDGVKLGADRDRAEAVEAEIVADIESRIQTKTGPANPEDVIRAITNEYAVREETVRGIIADVIAGDGTPAIAVADEAGTHGDTR